MARVDGLEVHKDKRFTAESLVSAGNSELPLRLWGNAQDWQAPQKKLYLFNNSAAHIYSQIHVTTTGADVDGRLSMQFADDVAGAPGAFADDKQLAVVLNPGQSVAFWARANKSGAATTAHVTDDVIMQAYANQDNTGQHTYEYNADTVLSLTKRLQSRPFNSYSKVEGLSVEVDFAGYLDGFMVSSDGLDWIDATSIVNVQNGAVTFPVPTQEFMVRAEVASGVINEWTLTPLYAYRY
jgi:hypothetical protein